MDTKQDEAKDGDTTQNEGGSQEDEAEVKPGDVSDNDDNVIQLQEIEVDDN